MLLFGCRQQDFLTQLDRNQQEQNTQTVCNYCVGYYCMTEEKDLVFKGQERTTTLSLYIIEQTRLSAPFDFF